MSLRKKCSMCGKSTRHQDGVCESCRIHLAPICVDSETNEKNGGGKKMNTLLKVFGSIVLGIAGIILFVLLLNLVGCNPNSITAGTTVPTSTTATTTVPTETTAAIATASADGKYVLDGTTMDFSKVIGFVPDENLLISELKPEVLGLDEVSLTRDFQKYLNTERNGFGCLAGYTDGTNDYNQYYNHQSAPQVPAYSWLIHTGEYIQMPGIGTLTGSKGNAVLVLIINRTDKVYRFPDNSVTVIAGFQGWGRIWNGESKEVVETEKRLTNHYLTRLGEGVPETGFIGQTDQGSENASTVTVVTVEMLDVGQFRLIRAETIPAMK